MLRHRHKPCFLRHRAVFLLIMHEQAVLLLIIHAAKASGHTDAQVLLSEAQVVRPSGLNRDIWEWDRGDCVTRVSQIDATRILTSCFLEEDFYDVIDIDSFGRCVVGPGHWIATIGAGL